MSGMVASEGLAREEGKGGSAEQCAVFRWWQDTGQVYPWLIHVRALRWAFVQPELIVIITRPSMTS